MEIFVWKISSSSFLPFDLSDIFLFVFFFLVFSFFFSFSFNHTNQNYHIYSDYYFVEKNREYIFIQQHFKMNSIARNMDGASVNGWTITICNFFFAIQENCLFKLEITYTGFLTMCPMVFALQYVHFRYLIFTQESHNCQPIHEYCTN